VSLNYHTLHDFRVGRDKLLDELFTQVLAALTEREVVTVERISQDGKRVRALRPAWVRRDNAAAQ